MALSYHCQNCGADLIFDADRQQMYCQHCGAQIDPDKIISETQEENQQDPAEQEEKQQEPVGWDENAVQYTCDSCGAAIVTDQNTAATFCVFCGNSAIIPERLTQGYRPALVLPFTYGKDAAKEKFFAWCKKGRMTPKDFVAPENVEKITGLYVPCWLFDYQVHMDIEAKATTVSAISTGNTTTTTTSHYDIRRKREAHWNRIPRDGASHVDDEVMAVLEPYDYQGLKDFDMMYLAGFLADKYDVTDQELTPSVQHQVEGYVENLFKESAKNYSSVKVVSDSSQYEPPHSTYALLPVWFLNYKYNGKTYTFAMNGQTGKVAGQPPVSRPKVALASLLSLVGGAVVFFLLSLLIVGMFFPTSSRPSSQRYSGVYDNADLFSSEEEQKIAAAAEKLSDIKDINAIVVTVSDKGTEDSYSDSSSEQYAKNQYKSITGADDGSPYDYSGFLFLIDMQTRYLYVFTYDRVHDIISNTSVTAITDSAVNEAKAGNYSAVTLKVLSGINQALDANARNKAITTWVIRLVLPLITTFFIVLALVFHKRSKKTINAHTYFDESSMVSNEDQDTFTHNTVSVVRHSSGSGGGGGGGGGGRSGGGGSHF